MSSIPIDAESPSSPVETMLERVRDGLRAEHELIHQYLDVYRRENSIVPAPLLMSPDHKSAERLGTDLFDIICRVFADRLQEIEVWIKVFASSASLETEVGRRVRRELARQRKQQERSPIPGSHLLAGEEQKGYAPATAGEPHSSILFRTYDAMLESAIEKLQRDDDSQQMFYRVLARLYVLKKWTYEDLASLVFGPDQSEVDLRRHADRISKWIKPAVRDLKAKKKRGRESGEESPAVPPLDEKTDIF
jgi:hypothetical protein